MALPPEHFEQAVRSWMAHCLGLLDVSAPLQAVALDGKTLRGALQPHQQAVHLLSLLDQASGCTLSQTRVDEKTNEAKTALELLHTLVLKGRVITGDAMFCQRDVCEAILKGGGHYFFVVKDNQPTLRETLAAEFKAAFSPCDGISTSAAS
jgi:Transposase DDE domain